MTGSGIANITIDAGQSVPTGTRYRLTITYDDTTSDTVDFIAPVGPRGLTGATGTPGTDASDIDTVNIAPVSYTHLTLPTILLV